MANPENNLPPSSTDPAAPGPEPEPQTESEIKLNNFEQALRGVMHLADESVGLFIDKPRDHNRVDTPDHTPLERALGNSGLLRDKSAAKKLYRTLRLAPFPGIPLFTALLSFIKYYTDQSAKRKRDAEEHPKIGATAQRLKESMAHFDEVQSRAHPPVPIEPGLDMEDIPQAAGRLQTTLRGLGRAVVERTQAVGQAAVDGTRAAAERVNQYEAQEDLKHGRVAPAEEESADVPRQYIDDYLNKPDIDIEQFLLDFMAPDKFWYPNDEATKKQIHALAVIQGYPKDGTIRVKVFFTNGRIEEKTVQPVKFFNGLHPNRTDKIWPFLLENQRFQSYMTNP